MKVLLSAYSCRPGCGSELGVGWRWARELALSGRDVWLLTRTIFKPYLEEELNERPLPHLRVVYYDPPPWTMRWGIYMHYYIWQIGVLRVARELSREVQFDVAQHITLGVFRQPSLLSLLPVPFVFGPVGGGESAPPQLRRHFPIRGRVIDLLRDLANRFANFDPILRLTYTRSALLLCKTEDTRRIIPRKYRDKAYVRREIGIDRFAAKEDDLPCHSGGGVGSLKVLFVGRLIYWKGLHLALRAFASLKECDPEAEITVIGVGKEEQWLRRLASDLGVDAAVTWMGQVDHPTVLRKYKEFDVFLFPSLHDSSGNVVLEAMSAGLPVICLDIGGPPTMVDSACGQVIPARDASQEQVIAGLSHALVSFSQDREYRERCAKGAMEKAREGSWKNTVEETYRLIATQLGTSQNRILGTETGVGK